MNRHNVVGSFRRTIHGEVFDAPLVVSPGYGMMCTALGVTNGYIMQCAINIKQMFASLDRARKEHEDIALSYVFTLEDEVLDVPGMTKEALFARLKAVYEKYGE
ncbi:hypothetical protein D3C71_1457350 [compost metagenome]